MNAISDSMFHSRCVNNVYPKSQIKRFALLTDKIPWSTSLPDYNPPLYTDPHVLKASWADPEIDNQNFKPKFNDLDGNIDRRSHHGLYKIYDGYPLNIVGRTGLRGRGLLGKWGPNHAADPVVTRWKRLQSSTIIECDNATGKPILEFIAIARSDSKEWAIPGIYKGYVDDPRNTDNAWMETVAVNFHDEAGKVLNIIKLEAGDDAGNVKWMTADSSINLYASHRSIIEKVVKMRNAHW